MRIARPGGIVLITIIAFSALFQYQSVANAETLNIVVPRYSSKTDQYFTEIAAAFTAANPDTKIQIDSVPWDVLWEKLKLDEINQSSPDLAIINSSWLYEYLDRDLIEPLNSYMDDAFRHRFIDAYLTPSQVNDITYGLPIAASIRALYYNLDLFRQAGLEASPETWEELAEAAILISELDDDIWGFGIPGMTLEVDTYFYYAFLAFGGKLLNDDGTSGLNSEAGYKAAALYRSLIEANATQPGVTNYDREDLQALFKKGKLGMLITAPFLATQIKTEVPQLQYDIHEVPSGPEGHNGTYSVADPIIMFKSSKVKALAWDFLEMLFRAKWREKFTIDEGFLPTTYQVATSPTVTEDAILQKFNTFQSIAPFVPNVSGWRFAMYATIDALQRIYLGEADIKSALDEAARRINRNFAKLKRVKQ